MTNLEQQVVRLETRVGRLEAAMKYLLKREPLPQSEINKQLKRIFDDK